MPYISIYICASNEKSFELASVGYSGFWSDGGCNFMVCTHERPIVCLCFQPFNACDCGLGWFHDVEREAIPRKVYIFLFYFFIISVMVISYPNNINVIH